MLMKCCVGYNTLWQISQMKVKFCVYLVQLIFPEVKKMLNVLLQAINLHTDMYQKICFKIRDSLSSVSHVRDIQSSVAQDSYISLTCHYIASDFTQQQVCLHAAPFNDHHTGERIGSMITRCLDSWNFRENEASNEAPQQSKTGVSNYSKWFIIKCSHIRLQCWVYSITKVMHYIIILLLLVKSNIMKYLFKTSNLTQVT